MAGEILVATETVLTHFDGDNVYIYAGDLADAGAAIVKGREAMFAPVQVRFAAPEPEPKPAAARPAAKKGTVQ